MSDDRPPCYHEGDTLVIRASSLGGPVCQLVASGLGNDILPPPPWLAKAFAAGNYWEGPVLGELRRRGWRDVPGLSAQDEHDWPVVPGVVIRFHPDDVLLPVGDEVPSTRQPLDFPEGPVLVEAKALSAANYEVACRDGAEHLPYAYDWQLSAMMIGLGLPAVWVTVDKSKGPPAVRAEGNADEWDAHADALGSLHAQWVATPPVPKAAIIRRVLLIRKLIEAGDIPSAATHHGASPCRFLYLCPEAGEQKDTKVLSGSRGDEVARWARWYEQQKEVAKLAYERKEEARGQLLELLGEDAKVLADGWVVDRKVGDRKGYQVEPKEGVVTLTVRRG